MKKSKIFLISLLILMFIACPVISSATTPNPADAIMLINEDNGNLVKSEEISEDEDIEDESDVEILEDMDEDVEYEEDSNLHEGDMYIFEKEAKISKNIDGNLYVCADTVTIDSEIMGDAFIMAETIEIGEYAYISNNLFAMANKIKIKGDVYDVYACCEDFEFVNATAYRSLRICAEKADISGMVGQNVYATCKNLSFGASDKNAEISIGGNLEYMANQEASIPRTSVEGNIEFKKINITRSMNIEENLLSLFNFICTLVLVWLALIWLGSKFLDNSKVLLKTKKGSIILHGILGIIVLPIISVVLLVSSVASTAGLTILALYILLLILAKYIAIITISNKICEVCKLEKNIAKLGIILACGLVIWASSFVPYVNTVISIAAAIIGLGIVITHLMPKKSEKTKEE